jgi:predicted dehydrogenase
MPSHKITRRTFAKASTAALATGARLANAQTNPAQTSHERIRLAFIGVGGRGQKLIRAFQRHEDAEIVALCDVDQRSLAEAKRASTEQLDTYSDFRRVIDRSDVDAVVIATPDHWHAIQTISACDAGKDVYVEKPLCATVHEGRQMVEAARRNRRVVQVGTHRRSSPLCADLAKRTTGGEFGKICVSRAYRLNNMFPEGIGRHQRVAPPKELDWDMWLGPRPIRPYQDNITPYKFRWWNLYSSQMGNWGVHYLDAIRWCLGEIAPSSVCAMGGRYVIDDDRTIPDTMEVCFEFASGALAIFGQYESSGNPVFPTGEIELRGTQGTVYVSGDRYRVVPEQGGQFQKPGRRMEPQTVKDQEGDNMDMTILHARNFLDCMRSRKEPNADIEIGHRSTTFSLIANISLKLGQRLNWDHEQERFTNSDEANQHLHYEYRKPWTLA